jgi:hypothetical protein
VDTGILNGALIATLVAMILVAFEMRASLTPAACPECAHCKAVAHERARREQELQARYAREQRLEVDEDDDRRL